MVIARRRLLQAAVAAGFGSFLVGRAIAAPRIPTIDDYLATEQLGLVRPSPDGRWLALEVKRGRGAPATRVEDQGGDPRSDIWLLELQAGILRQLTSGGQQGVGYWNPIWSPDSQHLAVLTNAEAPNSRPAIIAVNSGAVILYGRQSVNTDVNFGSPVPWPPIGRVWGIWRSSSEFLTTLLPVGAVEWWEGVGDPAVQYGDLWKRTKEGKVAVTVWDSRTPVVCGAKTDLVGIDLRQSGFLRVVASGAIRSVTLSPKGRHAAIICAVRPRALSAESPVRQELGHNAYSLDMMVETGLSVVDMATGSDLGVAAGVAELGFGDVRRHPVWDAAESMIAVPSFSPTTGDRVYRVDVPSLQVESFKVRSPLDAELVSAMMAKGPGRSPDPDRLDLSAEVAGADFGMSVPGAVLALPAGGLAVVRGEAFVELDVHGRPQGSIAIEHRQLINGLGPSHLMETAIFPSTRSARLIDQHEGVLRSRDVSPPTADSTIVGVVPRADAAIWTESQGGPVRIRVTSVANGRDLATTGFNDFLAGIWRPNPRPFRYTQPDGQPALAAVLLPPGYSADHRYPLVIHGYPNAVVTDENLKDQGALGNQGTAHRVLLCAQGCVVVVPSMPLPPGTVPFEPLNTVAGQIEALAEALLRDGLATKGRIGFIGHSYGGYAALAVAARTNVVNAVVASSPFSDLIEYHDLTFSWYERDTCAPSRKNFHSVEVEASNALLLRMNGTPDTQLKRYLDNSPRYQFSGKCPPVLMLDGEFDVTSFTQVDAAYTVLSRYGVPVKLQRYWGEGHNLGGPGNIRHAWESVRDWFDEYLGGGIKKP